MEEVDNIILQALHQLGLVFNDDVTTLADFPENLVLPSVKKCLHAITGHQMVQLDEPTDTSQKISLANHMVSQCMKLGFKGELGYEHILYPNEVDLRRIFTFLIDKLPKDSDKSFIPRDNFSLLMQSITQKLGEELSKPWSSPHYHKKNTISHIGKIHQCTRIYPFCRVPFTTSEDSTNFNEEFLTYWKNNVSDDNASTKPVTDSEAEAIMDKLRQSKSTMSKLKMTSLIVSQQNTESGYSGSNRSGVNPSLLSMKELADTIKQIEEEKENMINKIKLLLAKKDELSKEINVEKAKHCILNEKWETHQLVTSLLPEYGENIGKLKKITAKENTKLANLKNEMATIETKAQKEKEVGNEYKAKQTMYANDVRMLEIKKKLLREELKKQSAVKLQLKRDCEKRNIKKKYIKKRSVYTKRIMEIIGNVAKQKLEINKILSDTRILQKEMNNLNGRLDRSFTVVDELVFKDAKRDEHARKTYKLIAFIHTGCGDIVNNVNEIGSTLREIRDLEKRVEAEKKKRIEENLQRVYSDLKYLQSKKDRKEK